MRIFGSPREIEWVKQTLQNNCEGCPYEPICTASAVKEQKEYGVVRQSCRDFLDKNIEFITGDYNI